MTGVPGRDRRALALACGAALVLRLAVVVASRDAEPLIDMAEYHRLASSLAQGKGYATDQGPTAFREPLYPLFLASVYAVAGKPSVQAARVAQAVLGASEVVLAYVGTRALGWEHVALPAAWMVALYPDRALYASYLHREILLGPLWLSLLVVFLALRRSPSALTMVAAGAVTAAAGLCNAVLLVTAAAHSLLAWRVSPRRMTPVVMGAWAVAIALVTPWAYRNWRVLGHWVWTDTKGGNALWEGNNEGWLRGLPEMTIRQAQWDSMRGMGEVEANRFARRKALEFMRKNPHQAAYLWWRKALQFWRLELMAMFYLKQGYWGDVPGWAAVLAGLILIPVFPGVMMGATAGVVTQWARPSVREAVFLVGCHCAATSLFIGGYRYHYPVVPLLCGLAAWGWQSRAELVGKKLLAWILVWGFFALNFLDHVVANWDQVAHLLGRGGRFHYSDTRSWMKRGFLW